MAEIWFCNEAEALVQVLMKTQERQWDALEQAYMIKELQERHHLSQDRIAALMGKDKSWVSRRVSLLHVLPDEILQMVRTGHVSIWAATRVLAPLARANPDHAKDTDRIPLEGADLHSGSHHLFEALPKGQ